MAVLSAIALAGSLVVLDASPAQAAPAVGSLNGCGNGAPPDADACNPAGWQNGNLNQSNSTYQEGDSVPYRATFVDLVPGTSYFVDVNYDTVEQGRHAFDYLTTFNRTVGSANPCAGIAGCDPNTWTAGTIPPDPQVTAAIPAVPGQIPGEFRLFGGTITAVSGYTYPDGAGFAGSKTATIRVTFTADTTNPVLAWGGHIASRTDWGPTGSASAINGSSYHMRISGLNGAGGGGGDRSLSAAAIVSPSSITIVKDAVNNSATNFGFTATGLPLTGFTLDDDAGAVGADAEFENTQVFDNLLTFGDKTITEAADPSGWSLTGISCTFEGFGTDGSSTAGRTATIKLAEGQDYVCTFTNTQVNGSLEVTKLIGGTGTLDPSDFTMQVRTGGANGTVVASAAGDSDGHLFENLPAGQYTVTETGGGAGYTGDFASCGGTNPGTSGTVTVTAGSTATCTVTNSPATLGLTVTKTASPTSVPESGGNVTYTVTVTNTSPVGVTVVSPIDDSKFGTLDGDSDCMVGTELTAADPNSDDDSCTFTFEEFISGQAGTTHDNTVTVNAEDAEERPVSGFDDASVAFTDVDPSIRVVKNADRDSVDENTTTDVVYTVSVTNDSSEPVTIDSVVDDQFTPALGGCAPGTVLAPADQSSTADSCSFQYTGTVPAGDAGEDFVNTVTATVHDDDEGSEPAVGSDSATVERDNVDPSIRVVKNADRESVPEALGGNVTYTVSVTNDSPEPVTIDSVVDDQFDLDGPGDLGGCAIGTVLAPADPDSTADSCSFQYTGTVPAGDAGDEFVNTVTATASDTDDDSEPAVDSDSATVARGNVEPSIRVVKNADRDSINENTATDVVYTVSVTNDSSEPVTIDSVVDDTFTPDLGSCAPGTVLAPADQTTTDDSCAFQYTGTVPAGNAGEDFVNTVTATAHDDDEGSEPAVGSDSATVERDNVDPSIRVVKNADRESVPENVGADVTYSVSVTNDSNEPVTIDSVVDDRFDLDDPEDLGGCASGTVLAPADQTSTDDSCWFSYVGHVDPQPFGEVFTNTVTATAHDDDEGSEPAVGSDSATITFSPVAHLTVTKTACPAETAVPPGGYLTYTITAGNDGHAPATNAVLVDELPDGVSVQDADGGTVSEDGSTITWDLDTIDVGESIPLTVVVFVDALSGTLENTVTLSADAVADATDTVETEVSNAGAQATGHAYGADVQLLGESLLGTGALGEVNASSPPSPDADSDEVLDDGLSGIVNLGVLRQTATSDVGVVAVGQGTATTADINLLGGLLTADVVKGVSTSVASATGASHNTLGSTFTNLKINGDTVANVNPNTELPLKLLGITIAKVVLLEQTGDTAFGDPFNTASGSVNMIHVTLLMPLGDFDEGAEIIVGHADSSARYPDGRPCGAISGAVFGEAFTAFAQARLDGTPVLTLKQGEANLAPTGGADADEILSVDLPGLAQSTTGRNTTSGSLSPRPNATARSIVEGANVLGGLITARAIDVRSTSTTNGNPAIPNTVLSATFVDLRINGEPIDPAISPNTPIAIPQADGSLVLIMLNEQQTISNSLSTFGRVNALHVWVLRGGIVDVEVIVGSASSGAQLPLPAP